MLRTFRGGLLIGLAVAIAVAAAAITYERYDTKTLKRTIRRGEVLCGVNKGLPGFSIPDDKGDWTGFDVDFCRAVAAAIFDDPKKAKFLPLDASERFKELQSRKVDILSRNSTWSMSRETNYDLYFPAVAYYDGQGFMLPRSRNIDSGARPQQQQGLRAGGDDDAAQPRRPFPRQQHEVHGSQVSKLEDVLKAYEGGKCDTFTADVSQLYALRLEPDPAERPRHPARRHLQGAARTRGAAARRRLDDAREVDAVRDDQRRGTRRHLEEHRRGAKVEESRT
jgi:general L-amino acid transport system substrate-binding protein